MRGLALAAALAIGLAFTPMAARAGAWPQDEDRWLVIHQFTYSDSATNGYGPQGQRIGHGSFKQFEFSPYIEYGVTPDWTVGIQPRIQYANLSVPAGQTGAGSTFGLAEVNLFARYTIYRWDYDVVAVQGMFGAPGYAGKNNPLVANPWAEAEARVMYGHSFDLTEDVSGFFDTELAYRYEGGHNADQIHSDTMIGFRPDPDWLLMANFNMTLGLGNNTGTGGNYDQYRIGAAIGRRIGEETWIVLGGYHDIAGSHVALGNGVTLALWTRF
jgi:hypothetical protein